MWFSVQGFKSIQEEQKVHLGGLTILAGANNSGKTAIMQPLLLLKQTVESPFDPGALRLDGPNVEFTSWSEFSDFSRGFSVGFFDDQGSASVKFAGDVPFGDALTYRQASLAKLVRSIVHLGIFREPRREAAPKSGIPLYYPGNFNDYAPSTLLYWRTQDEFKLDRINRHLAELGFDATVRARAVTDARIETRVKTGGRELHLLDVGTGVAHSVLLLAGLEACRSGMTLYVQDPESHLHPRAQRALGFILAEAANRTNIIAETHSSTLIRALQTAVAQGKLPPNRVHLHWFSLENGHTSVTYAQPDENGAFGDWPSDFDEVALETAQEYIDAVVERSAG